MNYSISVVDAIDQVDREAWNRLRAGDDDLFTDVRLIRAVEQSMTADARFWHVLIRDADQVPVAALSLCALKVDATLLADGAAKTWAEWISRFAPWAFRFPVMFCGLPISAGQSNLRLGAGADVPAVLRLIDGLLLEKARAARAKCIVLKEFGPEQDQVLAALADLGYQRADSLPMNNVPTGYTSFEDYCNKLNSRKRYPLRKSQKKFAESGLRVVSLLGGEGADQLITDEVHRLYLNVLNKAKVRLERIPAETFRALARELPDNTAFNFIYEGERPVAFSISVFSAGSYHQMFVGVDHAVNDRTDLYFNLFFVSMDHAFRQGCPHVVAGQSADDFKHQKLSAWHSPLYFYVKGADWISAVVIRKAFHLLFPSRASNQAASGAAATVATNHATAASTSPEAEPAAPVSAVVPQ